MLELYCLVNLQVLKREIQFEDLEKLLLLRSVTECLVEL